MSPEINGNPPPPSVTRRKKNNKKPTQTAASAFDLSMPIGPQIPQMHPPYTASIPDMNAYYSFVNGTNGSGAMSLPIHPMHYYNNNQYGSYMGLVSTPKHPHGAVPIGHGPVDTQYMSLPPDVGTDLLDSEESNRRRFSDPGLPPESDVSSASYDEHLVRQLNHQVDELRQDNRKLARQVMEMRLELDLLKQQQSMRHYERGYEPGMLADMVREVRDAARVREDAFVAKVKLMLEEKQLSMNHFHLVSEKNSHNDRLTRLEEQLKTLHVNQRPSESSSSAPTDQARQVLELEQKTLELRRELQDTRAKKEESDQKLLQLDRKYNNILQRNGMTSSSDFTDDTKDNKSITENSVAALSTSLTPRVTLSGPVTDL